MKNLEPEELFSVLNRRDTDEIFKVRIFVPKSSITACPLRVEIITSGFMLFQTVYSSLSMVTEGTIDVFRNSGEYMKLVEARLLEPMREEEACEDSISDIREAMERKYIGMGVYVDFEPAFLPSRRRNEYQGIVIEWLRFSANA